MGHDPFEYWRTLSQGSPKTILHIRYLYLKTIAKLKLWSSSKNNFTVGVTTTRGTVLKGWGVRKVENHYTKRSNRNTNERTRTHAHGEWERSQVLCYPIPFYQVEYIALCLLLRMSLKMALNSQFSYLSFLNDEITDFQQLNRIKWRYKGQYDIYL